MAKKILVVDDEPDILKALAFRLEKSGFETLQASDGKRAIEIARQEVPDLIILDVYLPLISGDDVAKMIKEDESLKHIPIILISASTKILEEDTLKHQADVFLKKPFFGRDLVEKVTQLLNKTK